MKKRGMTKNQVRHIAHRTLTKAAVSFACILAMVGGMILESLPMPVAYSLESVLVCGKQEHVHSDSCWSQSLVCGTEDHEHSDACYEKTLICGAEEHVHSASCYATIEATPTAQQMDATDEEPVQVEEPAAPVVQETPEPTPAETPEPTPAETPAATAEPEPTPEETPAATHTPEPTSEATAEPELMLSNLTVSSALAKVGETLRWTFECVNAEALTYAISDETGALVSSGAVGADHTVEWVAATAGIYTMVVTAVRGEQQAQLKSVVQIEAITSDVLTVSVISQQRYAFANRDALVFDTSVSGGTEPVHVEYEIRTNGSTVYTHSGYETQISYMPQEFGVHTLTMTAMDANGQRAQAEYAIPVAVEERERPSEWERTFAQVELTGNFAEDILAIARTQLGYAESQRDFVIDEDGVQHGYTRYGAWYGSGYTEWCAMFVSFCAHYAQIPEKFLPLEANCAKWKQKLDDRYLDDEDNYAPEAGDLIFFHYNRTEDQRAESEKEKNVPNHVGIVTGTDKYYIYTIEGNSAGSVRECKYEWDDEHIVGYVSMAAIMQLANPEEPSKTEVPFDGAAYVRIAADSVNLRAEASADSESLGHANKDDLFQMDGQEENEAGEIWYRISYGEKIAYVRSDLAEAHAATANAESQPDANEETDAFERLSYEGEMPDGMERLENGLLHYADEEGEIYLVYGRYGEGKAQFYLCDAEGNPFGEDARFDAAATLKTISMIVTVATDKELYLDKDNNTVSLTIVLHAEDKAALAKNSTLTLTINDAVPNLKVDSISTTGGAFDTPSSSGNTITAKITNSVQQNTVTVKCHYTIASSASYGERTITVTASDGKDAKGSGIATYTYSKAEGVGVNSVSVPQQVFAPGDTVSGTVNLKNYDAQANTVTKLVVKDAAGNVVCTQENLTVSVDGNGTGNIPFAFSAPTGKFVSAKYTVEVTYGDGKTNAGSFAITLPDEPQLEIEKKVSVAYDDEDNASFNTISVTATDYTGDTDKKRNQNNAANLQIRGADGKWTRIASASGNIESGAISFNLLRNSNVTPDAVLNSLFRVELTQANKKDVSAESEWFYLTDSLPKAGFREWVLNPENGYLDENGKLIGDMDALAEAYKKYSRLGLTVSSESVTGEAGQSAVLPVRVKSDEAMSRYGVIEIALSDGTAEGAIAFAGCIGQSDFGSVRINSRGNIELTLNQSLAAGSEAVVNVTVPLGYDAALGAHSVAIDAKYRGASSGAVQKQAQGAGEIVVTPATGWHILSVTSPASAAMPGGNVTFTLNIRNFDPQEVTLNAVQAALADAGLEIVGIRQVNGDETTEIPLDNVSIGIPAATGEDDSYQPGDAVLQLRVKAPDTAMSSAQVDFALTDTNGHEETAQGLLSVVEPTLTIQPVVDYDPSSGTVTVKLVAQNAGSPRGTYTWQNLDTRNAYADWKTIATTGSTGELTLTGEALEELQALGADSILLQYRLTDASGDTVYATSNAAAFENLPQLMKAVEVVAKLAEHYGYSYSDFRDLIDHLYYVEVAKDSGVPFSDANSLMLYLQSRYESGDIASVVKAWEKYRYDLYDPREWPTNVRTTNHGATKQPETIPEKWDFGDQNLNWDKDEVTGNAGSPFHDNPASKIVEASNNGTYFDDLKKTASAVEDGDANTERRYTIDLEATPNGNVMVPAAMVFQIQTSWQMFDLDHANGKNGPKGTPCKVESMATLYDIKHGMIDFAEWLRTNSDGSIVFAITDVEHNGTHNAISAPYFTNDADTLIAALESWDIFGNCEHVHYSQQAYTAAVTALQNGSYFSKWTGTTANGKVSLYPYAKKIAVVIGGATENTSGNDGYGCTLDVGNMDYLYTIRANSGTASPYLSWLDNPTMTSQAERMGKAYKNVDTRTKVKETLIDIVKDYQSKAAEGAIQNVVLTDTITDEFDFVENSARVVTEVNGQEKETKVSVTLSKATDTDGKTVTRVSYRPASVTPGEKLHLRFDVVAKENYIGSNNVYTNEGKATLSYTNRLVGNASYQQEFSENPQVNVPIRYNIQDGGEVTVGVGTEVDLWSLGETIVKEMAGDTDGIEDWSVRYDQINGTVTYQWMKNVGTEEDPVYEPVSEESQPVHVTNGVPDGDGFNALSHMFSSQETGDFPFVLKTTFTPDAKSDAWSGVNDGAVNPLTKYGKVLVHVVKSTDIQVVKLDAQTNALLADAVFALSQDGKTLTFAAQSDGSYALSESGSTELVTGEDGRVRIVGLLNGSYVLTEKSAPQGYATDTGSVAFTTKNGAIEQYTENGERWSCDADVLTITLKNEVETKPTPIPYPTPPAKGNETSMTVRKKWSGDADNLSKRPSTVTVQMQMNGMDCGDSVQLSESNNWEHTWDKLPYKDENGEEIKYSAIEVETGEWKQWYDVRYGEVETVKGEAAGTYWVITDLSDLKKTNDSGTYAIYSGGMILQRSSDPATSVSTKSNQTHNGTTYTSELEKAPGSSAQWTITKVDNGYQIKNGNSYLTATEGGKLTYSTSAGNAVWNLSSGKLSVTYVKDKKGNTDTKWLKLEVNNKKDDVKLSLDNEGNATSFTFYKPISVEARNNSYVRQITNVYKDPNAKTKLVVKKVWANNGAYLHVNDTVTMRVYQNGVPLGTLTLNAEGDWSAELTDLPLYEVVNGIPGDKYVYSVEEEEVPNYTASGEGEATFKVTDATTGDGYYEATITNTRKKDGDTPAKPATSVNKRIDYLGDSGANSDTTLRGEDDYRLYLDFTGASEPIDVLFVIDTTGSMNETMGGGDSTKRETVVTNLMKGTNGKMGYLKQVATMNPANNVAVILFSGPTYGEPVNQKVYPYESNKADSQRIVLRWEHTEEQMDSLDYNHYSSGTYYDPAFMRAREVFSDPYVAGNGHRKVLIFMTDGEPNGYIDENLNYKYSESSEERNPHIMQAVNDFAADFPNVTRYTVGISSDIDKVQGLLSSIASPDGRFFPAYNTTQMTNALESIMDDLKPHDVVMTDELSPYVELNTQAPELKITRTNQAGESTVIWEGNAVLENGSIGSAKSGYEDVIQSVKYTASQSEDSTGTITVTFKPDYHVDNQYTYTLSYNVKATSEAYREMDESGEYPHIGDAKTDYTGNTTSSGKPGLRSNASANVEYVSSGKRWEDVYPHPVIQVQEKRATATPEITKTVELNGATPEDEKFAFAIKAVEPKDAPMPESSTAEWTYDENSGTTGTAQFGEISFNCVGTYVYRITETEGSNPNWSYDASSYLWTVTVARNDDNSLTATSALTKEGAEGEADTPAPSAEFVNEYVSNLALRIVKSDSTDHTKRLSGATFSLYSDVNCTNRVTVWLDEAKTEPAETFTTCADGSVTVYGLMPGTYYLKESAAPGGYCLIEGVLTVSVEKAGVTVDGEDGRIEANNTGTIPEITVYDSPIYDIPSTGGRGAWPFHAAGLALMLLAAAADAHRRRERGSGART